MIRNLIARWLSARHRCAIFLHHACHKGEHLCHSVYLGLVAFEAHGMYRYAAGIGVALVLLNYIFTLAGEAEV